MKKLVVSIMLLMYFVVSTGFMVSVHYCMDEVNAVELGASEQDDCVKCCKPAFDNKGCCKDEVKLLKMQADQLLSKLLKAYFSLPEISSSTTVYLFTLLFNKIEKPALFVHGPPLSHQDLNLQNRVFRI